MVTAEQEARWGLCSQAVPPLPHPCAARQVPPNLMQLGRCPPPLLQPGRCPPPLSPLPPSAAGQVPMQPGLPQQLGAAHVPFRKCPQISIAGLPLWFHLLMSLTEGQTRRLCVPFPSRIHQLCVQSLQNGDDTISL